MGLFDSIAGAIESETGGSNGGLMGEVMGLVNSPEIGGLAGLTNKLSENGLSGQVASWIGAGHNLPVSADQIESALGSDTVKNIAQKLGIDPTAVTGKLASLLPQVIDKLTPGGQLPAEGGAELSQALSGLSSLFGK